MMGDGNNGSGRKPGPPLSESEMQKKLNGGNSRLAEERPLGPDGRFKETRKYDPLMTHDARKLAKLGCTDLEIADYLGVKKRELLRWRDAHPEFDEALTIGQQAADARVEKALFQRAVGYKTREVKTTVTQEGTTRTITEKEIEPSVAAISMWLHNRLPEQWRKSREWVPPPPPADGEDRTSTQDLVRYLADIIRDTQAKQKAELLAAESTRH